jgi:hypothetical protein
MFPMLDRSIKHNSSIRWGYSESSIEFGNVYKGYREISRTPQG